MTKPKHFLLYPKDMMNEPHITLEIVFITEKYVRISETNSGRNWFEISHCEVFKTHEICDHWIFQPMEEIEKRYTVKTIRL